MDSSVSLASNGGSTKRFMAYFLAASSVAVASAFLVSSSSSNDSRRRLLSRSVRVWPDLEFNWSTVLVTVIGFLGCAFGTVGGVGGGGIFVPMLNLVVGFDTKSAAALSKCMIMGASASSVWYNLRVSHPSKEVPIIDYDLALLFQPMLMLGITIGVSLSVVFPYWLITVLIIILFCGTSSRSFFKGIQMWKQETILKAEMGMREEAKSSQRDAIIDAEYEPLLAQEEKSNLDILLLNLRWKGILVLMIVWFCFLLLQIIKNDTKECSPTYWILNILQVASATATFVMLFSSSLSVVEFYFLGRFPFPYAVYLIFVSVLAGFWGQFFVRKLVKVLKRASIIVFILSAVIFASAITMGVVGAEKTVDMIRQHQYMGFLSFCGAN
ncbi:uncharacterized protein A4U43_C03F24060 [Asparagus officinalis]|uniref:Sulfite exporter TauE/SafE family protein n=1 Tax=Asparagus officinalis TaxID=4686 RepID=A0A5P1FCJ1_ASPOF|nr:uncharacterized protein A4U43_C03F24060 [Asparagus officinalis]